MSENLTISNTLPLTACKAYVLFSTNTFAFPPVYVRDPAL